MKLLGGVPTTAAAVGADGEVPNLLASTVINCVADPKIEAVVVSVNGVTFNVMLAVIDCVLVGMAIRTFCVAGGAFWWGFHNEGSNQASN